VVLWNFNFNFRRANAQRSECPAEWSLPKNQQETAASAMQFTIFPNPSTQVITIEQFDKNNPDEAIFDFRLYGLNGTLILTVPLLQSVQQIALPKLSQSLYLGSIYRNGSPVFHEKLSITQ
jgi:hypothetical protein